MTQGEQILSLEEHLAHVNEQLRVATRIINERDVLIWSRGRKTEYMLIACSFWAGWELIDQSTAGHHLVTLLPFWALHSLGWFALATANTKIVGIVLFQSGVYHLCDWFRAIGLGMACLFWETIGVSTIIAGEAPLYGPPCMMIGIVAYLQVYRLVKTQWRSMT